MKASDIKKYLTHNRLPFFEIAKKYVINAARILDVGAGSGAFAKYIERDDVYCCDGNENTICELKNNFKNVFYCNLPNLPFENNFFDLIHCSHIVEHLEPENLYKLLVEIDRVLKINGILVISAPLLWKGFYDDLSHVKPYTPIVFKKYLVNGKQENATRKIISDSYKVIEEIFRYNQENYFNDLGIIKIGFINILLHYAGKIIGKIGFRIIRRSGFTLVLKKMND